MRRAYPAFPGRAPVPVASCTSPRSGCAPRRASSTMMHMQICGGADEGSAMPDDRYARSNHPEEFARAGFGRRLDPRGCDSAGGCRYWSAPGFEDT
jgi:hypothetical protein